jgi:hypothetical protein
VVVALFASHKESMYQDLLDNEDRVLGSDLVRAMALGAGAGLADDRFDFEEIDLDRIDELSPPEDSPLVLDADASQRQAVAAAVAGQSFVLDGPPGTGKSQTITNLIAASVAEGRRVLFVCEKRAALDVVAQRLRQVGLDQLVATIHDSQLDRKAFIADLGGVYHSWLADGADDAVGERSDALAAVTALLVPLERVFIELEDARGERRSVAEIIERLVTLRLRDVVPSDHIAVPDLPAGSWLDARERLNAVADELARTGRIGPLGQFDVLRVAPAAVADGDPVVAVRTLGEQVVVAAIGVSDVLGSAVPSASVTLGSVASISRHMALLTTLERHQALPILDPASGTHSDARAAAMEFDRLVAGADAARPVLDRWRAAPNAVDTASALEIARSKQNSAFRFLNGKWRKVNALLKAQYRYDLHQIEPAASQVLDELHTYHSAEAAVSDHRRFLHDKYGVSDVRSVLDTAEQLGTDSVVREIATGSNVDLAALERAVAAMTSLRERLVVDDGSTLVSTST